VRARLLVVKSIVELHKARAVLKEPVGLVPTMGYLHQGHLSLVKKALQQCNSVVVTIFVNPTQFGPDEDFEEYPRDEQRDLQMLEEAKVDIVFMPLPDIMYPEGFDSWVEVGQLAGVLEGQRRPGHFRGVATVVLKLFNQILPTYAYFGEKDAQQVRVIKKLVKDLDVNVSVISVPTVREKDGLAISSRNVYLSVGQREAASCIYKGLLDVQTQFQSGVRDVATLKQIFRTHVDREPLATLEYISFADDSTLLELVEVDRLIVVSAAVKFGAISLIDNVVLLT
jgi:pantoate--beta-alanine ligase